MKTVRGGHWMSDKLFEEVVEFVKCSGTFYHTMIMAEELLAKLDPPDPRPNFRATEHECCWACKWGACALQVDEDPELNVQQSVCNKFERDGAEPDEIESEEQQREDQMYDEQRAKEIEREAQEEEEAQGEEACPPITPESRVILFGIDSIRNDLYI